MNLADCYRLLGLKSGASFEEIKASYRRLARRYHPDVNPGDNGAKEQFIAVTEAYKRLLTSSTLNVAQGQTGQPGQSGQTTPVKVTKKPSTDETETAATGGATPTAGTTVKRKPAPIQFNPDLSPLERQLKTQTYEQLQQLLRQHRFPRAIALVEGLARRIPQDSEVVQWQAIVYQRWGRHLIQEQQFEKARLYLKKALRTDPHNRSLWAEVEKDFRYMEQLF